MVPTVHNRVSVLTMVFVILLPEIVNVKLVTLVNTVNMPAQMANMDEAVGIHANV